VKDIIGITGKNAIIEPPCFFDYGKFVTVGENFYANFGCVFLDGGYIEMGDDVMLAPGVQVSLRLKVYFSILLAPYVMWNGALDSSHVLLSYPITSLHSI